MPSNWLEIDSKLPVYSSEKGIEEKLRELYNYQYILAEQLQYGLSNLSTSNWNKADLDKFSESATAGLNDKLTKLIKSVSELGSSVSGLSGKVSSLENTSAGHSQKIKDILNSIKNINDKLEQLGQKLTGMQKNISDIKNDLTSTNDRLTAAESAIKELQGGK